MGEVMVGIVPALSEVDITMGTGAAARTGAIHIHRTTTTRRRAVTITDTGRIDTVTTGDQPAPM